MSPVTSLLPPRSVDDSLLTYVVMGARYREKWIFVRHHQRTTWEMPAGHIEPGEDPDRAALRELYEEAGVMNASLEVLSDYSVSEGAKIAYGRLYRAEVRELAPLPKHEIEEIKLCTGLPSRLTYPEVQTALFPLLSLH